MEGAWCIPLGGPAQRKELPGEPVAARVSIGTHEQEFAVRRSRDLSQPRRMLAALILGLWVFSWGGAAEAGPFEEGVDLFQAGHYRWALEKFVEAVDQAPRDPQRRLYLAETYRQLGEAQAAAQAYRQLMQMAPGSAQAVTARQALESLG